MKTEYKKTEYKKTEYKKTEYKKTEYIKRNKQIPYNEIWAKSFII